MSAPSVGPSLLFLAHGFYGICGHYITELGSKSTDSQEGSNGGYRANTEAEPSDFLECPAAEAL